MMLFVLLIAVCMVAGYKVFAWSNIGTLPSGPSGQRLRLLLGPRRVRRTIRDARQGEVVEIVGRVRLGKDRLESPYSRRSCAGYVTVFEELALNGLDWETRSQKTHCDSFLVSDETGCALIQGEDAQLLLMTEAYAYGRGGELVGLPRTAQEWRDVEVYTARYRDGALTEGSEVLVRGIASWEPDPNPMATHGYRELAQRLVLRAPPKGRLFVTDLPRLIDSG